MKKLLLFSFSILLLASCSKDSLSPSVDNAEIDLRNKKVTFNVKIEALDNNGSISYPFSPGVYLVQKKNSAPIFENFEADFGDGLEGIAEDGSPGTLNGNLRNHPKVRSHGVFSTPIGAVWTCTYFCW